jgi:hypothetical protein
MNAELSSTEPDNRSMWQRAYDSEEPEYQMSHASTKAIAAAQIAAARDVGCGSWLCENPDVLRRVHLFTQAGSRVRLLTTLSTRQKTFRKQTESLQRRERRKCAIALNRCRDNRCAVASCSGSSSISE